jgi:hypothetical protein
MFLGDCTEFSLSETIVLKYSLVYATGIDESGLTSRFRSSLSAAESMSVLREYCLEYLVVVICKVIVNGRREEIINIYLLRKIENLKWI